MIRHESHSRKSKLLQHRHLIPLLPAFDDPAVSDVIQNQAIQSHLTPRCGNGSESAVVSPTATHRVATLSAVTT